MKRLHFIREPSQVMGQSIRRASRICEKCGMLILSGDSTPVEEKWLASEVNCSKVQPHQINPFAYSQSGSANK